LLEFSTLDFVEPLKEACICLLPLQRPFDDILTTVVVDNKAVTASEDEFAVKLEFQESCCQCVSTLFDQLFSLLCKMLFLHSQSDSMISHAPWTNLGLCHLPPRLKDQVREKTNYWKKMCEH
jgi:hypothetical protein